MPNAAEVIAAGAVVTRHGGREVLLVHRPKYDDWSFPKGKQEPGEHVVATAVREVLEETGVRIRLGRPLAQQRYGVGAGRTKVVHYWVGRVLGDPEVDGDVSGYVTNAEISGVSWLPVAEAAGRLSYDLDLDVLDRFRTMARRTDAAVVVRHAQAHKRKTWTGPDTTRPLTREGLQEADALAPRLGAYGVGRVITSPSERCLQTVTPYAAKQGLPVEECAGLSEEGVSEAALDEMVADLLGHRESATVCTHRPVLPDLLERLSPLATSEEPLVSAEMVICHHRKGQVVAVERHQP